MRNYERRKRYQRAFYSLDAYDWTENYALEHSPSPEQLVMLAEEQAERNRLAAALREALAYATTTPEPAATTTPKPAATTTSKPTQTTAPKPAETEPAKTPAQPLTPEGNLDLEDDIDGEAAEDKQFTVVQSRNGHYFYIIVDRAEDGENIVHFLNQVDEADLLALIEEEEKTPAVCTCTEKCAPGAVNTSCEICAVNMGECAGKERSPVEPDPPSRIPKSHPCFGCKRWGESAGCVLPCYRGVKSVPPR